MKFKTREQWLTACAKRLEKLFKAKGYDVSPDYRVACGFPKSSGMGYSTIGQCWSKMVSKGHVSEIFISPVIEDPARAADILAHELAHHIVGIKAGHGKPFIDCVRSIGLEGKPTATVAGPEFKAWWEKNKGWLAEYPHHAIVPPGVKPIEPTSPAPGEPEPKWETTPRRASGRMVKWSCKCGMKWSTSVSQSAMVKACPACGEQQ